VASQISATRFPQLPLLLPTMMRPLLLSAAAMTAAVVHAAVPADLVTTIPGFAPAPFKVYSGYVKVPHSAASTWEYDELSIHYELHMSQGNPDSDPVVTWHQGGPGGSSLYGAYTEMGYFQVDSNGTHTNPHAWNRVANMLYLESPAGCDDPIGFSYCSKAGKPALACSWDDKTQADAYAATLVQFFKNFPELASNDLYLSGESYAGQYIPNIAHYIVNAPATGPLSEVARLNLKGIAVGNGCWGGTATEVQCNGPNSDRNDVDMYYGKGLISKKLYEKTQAACNWSGDLHNLKCDAALEHVSMEVGPHNVYDIYDNCPQTAEWLKRSGKSMRWLLGYLRAKMSSNGLGAEAHAELTQLGGGYTWSCDGMSAMANFFRRSEVQAALHLGKPSVSRFGYKSSGPASVTLYPELMTKMRVLIYNGDSDSCVPYKGNEEWTTSMETAGHVKELKAWHPWFTEQWPGMPAGYATTYNVTGAPYDFSFVTIRLAGHMVPTFQPAASFSFFSRFLQGTPF